MRINIEVERVRGQFTKGSLANRVGISVKTYANYVQETTSIPSDVLEEMADIFGCTTDYLLGRNTAKSSE